MKRSNILPKTGPCLDCGRKTKLIAGRCQYDYWKFRNSVKPKKRLSPHVPISPVSTKQKKRLAEYALVRAEYLARNPVCEARVWKVCAGRATQVHHLRGRIGKNLLDNGKFMAVCDQCHTWIHDNDAEARKRGLLLSRLKTEA